MKLKTIAMLAVASLGISASQAAITIWDGTVGDWHDTTKWSESAIPSIDDTDQVQVNAGKVTYRNNPSGDLNFNRSSSLSINNAEYAQNAGYWMRFERNATLSITNGIFSGPNRIEARGRGFSGANHTINNSTMTIGGLVADDKQVFNISNGSTVSIGGTTEMNNNSGMNITGATVTLDNLDMKTYAGNSGFISLFDGGDLNINGTFTTTASAFVNFSTATTTGSVFVDGLADQASAEALITGSQFGIAGAIDTNVSNYVLAQNGTGFNIAVVPEPSSTALLGLGGLALILRRRK